MSSTSRGPGRPRGADIETLEKGRLYVALIAHGVAPSDIALREGVSRSEVYRAINLAQPPAAVDPALAGAVERQPRPVRRLSRRIALYRAWDYVDRRPSFALGLTANNFWVRIVIAVHEDGDGFRLRIGDEGGRFRTRADLAVLLLGQLDRSEVDVEDWLSKLFEHGRLIDFDGLDVAIPVGLGLTAGENAQGRQIAARAPRPPAQTGQPNLALLRQVNGGREVSGEIPPEVSGEIRIFPDTLPPISPDTSAPISPDTGNFARTADTDANAKDIRHLASASAAESRAHVSGEITPHVSGEIPPDVSGGITESGGIMMQVTPPGSVVDLTARLKALVSPGRMATAKDLGAVQRMLDEGETAETIKDAIQIKMEGWTGAPPNGLGYFVNPLREARERRNAAASSNRPQPAPAPLSDADRALRDLLKPSNDAWIKNRSCPFAPTPDSFRAAGVTEKGRTLAYRWLELWSVWDKSGRPADLKPPDFMLLGQDSDRFETALLEIEEELTAPDPPQAAD